MDAKTLEFIEERNGFHIRKGNENYFDYHIFHPNFDGVYIDAFVTLDDAEQFCDEENAECWANDIRIVDSWKTL